MFVVDFFLSHPEFGVDAVYFYLFSTENWKREESEVNYLMNLAYEMARLKMREYISKGVRFVHLGRREPLPQKVLDVLDELVRDSASGDKLTVGLCINYGGRAEIIDAMRKMMADGVSADEVDEDVFARYLYQPGFTDVDAIVRTSGEKRLSNFLMWQSAYAELVFLPIYWPDINDSVLVQVMDELARRQRRFGR